MNTLVVIAFVVIVVGLLVVLKVKKPAKDGGLSFERRDPLFTPAERSFLGVLEQALDSRYRVFGKVRLGDIVKPARGLSSSKRTTAMNKSNQKHLDFVVCATADLAVIGVVELDDQSHGREDRAGRDAFVDQALNGAGIPVVRFSAKKGYAMLEVKAKLAEGFKSAAEPAGVTVIKEGSSGEVPEPRRAVDKMSEQPEEAAPACPKCAADMVKRQAKKGPSAGKFFWACSTYPRCRQVVAVEG